MIVSSHFNEDLDWLMDQNKFEYNVYSKNSKELHRHKKENVFECINKGHEASSYLSYIIDNYESLPDYVAFVHGHEYSYHQTDSTLRLIDMAFLENKDIEYFSINRKDWLNIFGDDVQDGAMQKNWNMVKENYNDLNIGIEIPKKLECTACAQFIVSKKNILMNSLEDYKNIMRWLEKTDLDSSISGRVLEHLWCYIFTHLECEKLKKT